MPFYLAANRQLLRAVRKGELITCSDVELDESSELLALRREQDGVFLSSSASAGAA
jgi:predicted homoserine dehydrogenase-like protein